MRQTTKQIFQTASKKSWNIYWSTDVRNIYLWWEKRTVSIYNACTRLTFVQLKVRNTLNVQTQWMWVHRNKNIGQWITGCVQNLLFERLKKCLPSWYCHSCVWQQGQLPVNTKAIENKSNRKCDNNFSTNNEWWQYWGNETVWKWRYESESVKVWKRKC